MMNTTKNTVVILLNGPIGSGKDFIAQKLKEHLGDAANIIQFKEELYRETAQHFNIPCDKFKELAQCRATKEVFTPRLKKNGKLYSPRSQLIHVSEDLIKPLHGKRFFGEKVVRNSLEIGKINISSDSGFYDEAIPLVERVGKKNVLVVHLFREGCTFRGDSRAYIDLTDLGVKTIKFENKIDSPPPEWYYNTLLNDFIYNETQET